MRRQVKVGAYQAKISKGVLRTCLAPRRNERGLGINEETVLLSPWQWGFKVDRMQSRFASSVDMGPCQPARFRKKCYIYYLKVVAVMVCVVTGEVENEEEESYFSLRRRFQR